MIEFITLFLGLFTGVQEVRLLAAPEVASVELRLDGEAVGAVSGEPWSLGVDFGSRLVPHETEAVAFDGEGAELGRSAQSINLPRPPAEARLVLDRDADGRPMAVRASWQSVGGGAPNAIRVTLDGEPLEAADPARVALPALDLATIHWLQADFEFPTGDVARAQITFGGQYADEASGDLTAVTVELEGKARRYDRRDFQGLFRGADGALDVVGVERGHIELIVVRGDGVAAALEQIEGQFAEGAGASVSTGTPGVSDGIGGLRSTASANVSERMQRALTIEGEHQLRVLLPRSRKVATGAVKLEIFPTSPVIGPEDGGLYWATTLPVNPLGADSSQRLADAVAVAGFRAAAGNHRRAVILILGPNLQETSHYEPAQARDYLRALGVPLEVWRLGEPTPETERWGDAHDVSDFHRLRRAKTDLEKRLDRQAIVWVSGSHLPGEIRLTESAKGVRLVR
jgi:hypothetical protein